MLSGLRRGERLFQEELISDRDDCSKWHVKL